MATSLVKITTKVLTHKASMALGLLIRELMVKVISITKVLGVVITKAGSTTKADSTTTIKAGLTTTKVDSIATKVGSIITKADLITKVDSIKEDSITIRIGEPGEDLTKEGSIIKETKEASTTRGASIIRTEVLGGITIIRLGITCRI